MSGKSEFGARKRGDGGVWGEGGRLEEGRRAVACSQPFYLYLSEIINTFFPVFLFFLSFLEKLKQVHEADVCSMIFTSPLLFFFFISDRDLKCLFL